MSRSSNITSWSCLGSCDNIDFAPGIPRLASKTDTNATTVTAADRAGSSCSSGGNLVRPVASPYAESCRRTACQMPQPAWHLRTVWGLPLRLSSACCGMIFLRSGGPLCRQKPWQTAHQGWEFLQYSPWCASSYQTSRGPGTTNAGHGSRSAKHAAQVIPCPSLWCPEQTSGILRRRPSDEISRHRCCGLCWWKGGRSPCSQGPSYHQTGAGMKRSELHKPAGRSGGPLKALQDKMKFQYDVSLWHVALWTPQPAGWTYTGRNWSHRLATSFFQYGLTTVPEFR